MISFSFTVAMFFDGVPGIEARGFHFLYSPDLASSHVS